VKRQRRAVLEVANGWVAAFPNSSDAHHVLALAREFAGDPSALSSYRQARELAADPSLRSQIGVSEVALQVRLALPDDLEGIREAVALGTALLSQPARRETAEGLADLAVLLGRPNLAARLARAAPSGGGLGGLPAEVIDEARALEAFAAVGGPTDSIRALEVRAESRIRLTTPGADERLARLSLLERPSFLAYPAVELRYLNDVDDASSPVARAIAALSRNDVDEALALLGALPRGAGWDILLAHANALNTAGESRRALDLLTPRLDSLGFRDPSEARGMARLGSLVRAAALRAELEGANGSASEAARWARAVEVIWSSGEAAADPLLERMRRISDPQGGR
jgi:hypothetical protein